MIYSLSKWNDEYGHHYDTLLFYTREAALAWKKKNDPYNNYEDDVNEEIVLGEERKLEWKKKYDIYNPYEDD